MKVRLYDSEFNDNPEYGFEVIDLRDLDQDYIAVIMSWIRNSQDQASLAARVLHSSSLDLTLHKTKPYFIKDLPVMFRNYRDGGIVIARGIYDCTYDKTLEERKYIVEHGMDMSSNDSEISDLFSL